MLHSWPATSREPSLSGSATTPARHRHRHIRGRRSRPLPPTPRRPCDAPIASRTVHRLPEESPPQRTTASGSSKSSISAPHAPIRLHVRAPPSARSTPSSTAGKPVAACPDRIVVKRPHQVCIIVCSFVLLPHTSPAAFTPASARRANACFTLRTPQRVGPMQPMCAHLPHIQCHSPWCAVRIRTWRGRTGLLDMPPTA